MNTGQIIGKFIVVDYFWDDDDTFVIVTNLVEDNNGDWYSLECYHHLLANSTDFVAVYEHDFVPFEENTSLLSFGDISSFEEAIAEYKKLNNITK